MNEVQNAPNPELGSTAKEKIVGSAVVVQENRSYKFTILKCVSDPGKLLFEEQKLINKLGTLRPYGLNFANPVNVGVNHLDFDS